MGRRRKISAEMIARVVEESRGVEEEYLNGIAGTCLDRVL